MLFDNKFGGFGKKLLVFLVLFCMFSSLASADTYISNSREWSDVYSVMLRASFDSEISTFVNDESLGSITRTVSSDNPVVIYESNSPFVPNLEAQMSALGYDVSDFHGSDDFSIDLDIESGSYILVSKDNYRATVSLVPLAKKLNAWVLIVTPENLNEVADKISVADYVLAVGDFRRDALVDLEPHFTEWINNNNVYSDSVEVAKRTGSMESVLLADGNSIESEFFTSDNPVLLSGLNKILDDTFDVLVDEGVKNVVIIGNELSVVGEQIRSNSDKQISVFVKFGQSDLQGTGRVYSLTYFPFPVPVLDLKITSVVYDTDKNELVTYFENKGNAGLYFLNTLSIENSAGDEIGSVSDSLVHFLGAGEILPISYSVDIPLNQIDSNTSVKFYASFGSTPVTLDTFLTMQDKYGPPFSLKLNLGALKEDNSNLDVLDVSYYKSYKRLGVTIKNDESETAYFAVKIPEIVVNGVVESLYKEDSIAPNSEKTTYIPVQLDSIDLEENSDLVVKLQYGDTESVLLKPYSAKHELFVKGGISIFLIGGVASVVLLLVIILVVVIKRK